MMKVFIVFTQVLFSASLSADTASFNSRVLTNTHRLKSKMSDQLLYKSFCTLVDEAPRGELQEHMIAAAILLSRHLRKKTAYRHYKKVMLKKYTLSDYGEILSGANLGVPCKKCEGEKTVLIKCSSCKGQKLCANKACKSGQISSNQVVNGSYMQISRACAVCRGTGNCQKCFGYGEDLASCGSCQEKGYVFSQKKSERVLVSIFAVINSMASKENHQQVIKVQQSKGKVLFEGKWLEADKVTDIIAKRKREEGLRKLRQQGDKMVFAEELAKSLLKQSKRDYEKTPQALVAQFEDFIRLYPQSSMLKEIYREMLFLKSFSKAVDAEEKGNTSEALKYYTKANSLKPSKKLQKKISVLDDMEVGL
ncbi:MAG: hypothetical protein HRT88_05360 [Lentisphaeraceae bacterium]|nr:hypothetical protein [Lentisphaeraceae bacterium]